MLSLRVWEITIHTIKNQLTHNSVSLLMKDRGTPKELPWPVIHGVASDLVMAGSDTVATVLAVNISHSVHPLHSARISSY